MDSSCARDINNTDVDNVISNIINNHTVDCYDLETFLRNDDSVETNDIDEVSSKLPSCCVQRSSSKTMDNVGFEQDSRATEMHDVSITLDKSRLNGHTPPSTSAGTSCRPEACRAARKKYLEQGPQSADQSPWHRRKTIYLFTVIALLIIWAIVYSTLHVNGIL